MTIEVTCPSCFHEHRVSDNKAGKRFRCRNCQEVLTVPDDIADDWDDWGADEEDDYEELPSPRKRKKKSGSRRKKSKRSSNQDSPLRSIRAICLLYEIFGGIFILSFFLHDVGELHIRLTMLIFGTLLFVAGFGVRSYKAWAVPLCKLVAFIQLLGFPIGPLLGGYILLNLDKVQYEFD